ncbi:MAG: hypothetical protein RSF88_10570 [Lachnospiraceae bacterium]
MEINQAYFLMHKDEKVKSLVMEVETGTILKQSTTSNEELMPLGARKSAKDFRNWWERRAVPVSQGKIKELLEQKNISTTQEFLLRNLGLSLIDHYWIKPLNSNLEWKDVSLFQNEFDERVLFEELDYSIPYMGHTVFVPSASLQGELEKKWIINEKKERILMKGNDGRTYQQSTNEVFAATLHEMQGNEPYTQYELVVIDTEDGRGMGCACKCFANESLEFIPAIDIANSRKKPNDMSEYEFFILNCVHNGLAEEYVRNYLEYQILSDFLITNTDRHFNNFGVLRNSDTLKFESMAPIFDSGNSLFWRSDDIIPVEQNELLNIKVSSFRKREVELLDYVQNPHLLNLNKIPSESQLTKSLETGRVPEEKAIRIVKAYQQKRNIIERLQHDITLEKIIIHNSKLNRK